MDFVWLPAPAAKAHSHQRSPASSTLPIVAPKIGVTELGFCTQQRRASFQLSFRVFLRSGDASPAPGAAVSTPGTLLPSISAIRTGTPGGSGHALPDSCFAHIASPCFSVRARILLTGTS